MIHQNFEGTYNTQRLPWNKVPTSQSQICNFMCNHFHYYFDDAAHSHLEVSHKEEAMDSQFHQVLHYKMGCPKYQILAEMYAGV